MYLGGRRGNNSRPHAKTATGCAWQGVARLPARGMPWQFLREGENCCHGDRLGTQASVQLANTTITITQIIYLHIAAISCLATSVLLHGVRFHIAAQYWLAFRFRLAVKHAEGSPRLVEQEHDHAAEETTKIFLQQFMNNKKK